MVAYLVTQDIYMFTKIKQIQQGKREACIVYLALLKHLKQV
jgi:hypothetical protein